MAISKFFSTAIIILLFSGGSHYGFSQKQISGTVSDTRQNPLAYVNIGIKGKNTGTVSKEDGSFVIQIPPEIQNDSLTFSLVGYYEVSLAVRELSSHDKVVIRLNEKAAQLKEVVIKGEKLIERKYGIKKRGVIHFTDGIFKKDDSFEIGQVISLGNLPVQVTSLNLYLQSSRPDSADFRINFYRFDGDIPRERASEKSILQRHPVREGWLKFDLSEYDILLKGEVLATIEFIPDHAEQIFYEVKLGGSSKSFFRKTSLGQWIRPPHHYCLYATVLTYKKAPEETDDEETPPAFTLKPDFSEQPYSFFVHLPKNYAKYKKRTWPVVYLLDGNIYFDPVTASAESLKKKNKLSAEPIIVGIGYENAYSMDSLRNRDYTFPIASPEDSFALSGSGDKFYNFIKSDVVRYVDRTYRTDTSSRTLMGHSLGGYFVLYALYRQMTDVQIFKSFVAASPSIFYHHYYITGKMKDAGNPSSPGINLYMTIGELETEENSRARFTDLAKIIKTNGIEVRSEILKGSEHMGTAIPTFENGIEILFNRL